MALLLGLLSNLWDCGDYISLALKSFCFPFLYPLDLGRGKPKGGGGGSFAVNSSAVEAQIPVITGIVSLSEWHIIQQKPFLIETLQEVQILSLFSLTN